MQPNIKDSDTILTFLQKRNWNKYSYYILISIFILMCLTTVFFKYSIIKEYIGEIVEIENSKAIRTFIKPEDMKNLNEYKIKINNSFYSFNIMSVNLLNDNSYEVILNLDITLGEDYVVFTFHSEKTTLYKEIKKKIERRFL